MKELATYERVCEAAEQLQADGAEVSVVSIRKMIGTGSNTTIGAHLKRWEDERNELKSLPPMPEGIGAMFKKMQDEIWLQVQREAQGNIRLHQEAMLKEQARHQRAEEVLLKDLDEKQLEIDAFQVESGRLKDEILELQKQLAAALGVSGYQSDQIAKHEVLIATLRSEIQDLQHLSEI